MKAVTLYVRPSLLATHRDAQAILSGLAPSTQVFVLGMKEADTPFPCASEAHLDESVAGRSSFLLEDGVKLSFYCPLPIAVTPILTLFFHTLEDAVAYVHSYPVPSIQIPALIEESAALIAQGKLVAFPTETVYGLGADAMNESAVRTIFTAKHRPFFDPLIIHIATVSQLDELAVEIDERCRLLMECFWPGPLTLVLKKRASVPAIVTANSQTVAIRMPANPFALNLIKASGKAIAAPSANRFGYTSPTTAQHVSEQLGSCIDAVLDGGACTVGIESTVLSLCTEVPTLLRPGKISLEDLKPLLGEIAVAKQPGPTDMRLESPGMLESHYAPKTPLYLVDDVAVFKDQADVGVLLFEKRTIQFKGPVLYVSEHDDPQQAASRLYWAIRRLDTMGLRCIVTTLLPEGGIGTAINNRLRKASTKSHPLV